METVSTTNVGFFRLFLLFSYEIFCSKRNILLSTLVNIINFIITPKTNSTLHGKYIMCLNQYQLKIEFLDKENFLESDTLTY
jgi:hypothetical protein